MNYAEIEAINRETAELTKRITLKWNIIEIVLAIFCLILICLAVRLIWEGIQEKKALRQQTAGSSFGEYLPTVTSTVQYDRFGTEYHRMGPVGRR